jgi:hemerythrin-like domain-containing protein
MSAPSTPRYDFYSPVHKGLRRTMSRLLERLGSGNFADAAQRAATLGELRVLIDACGAHIKHEDDFIHPTIEAKVKGASSKLAGEHDDHRKEIAHLHQLADAVEKASEQSRPAQVRELYLAFSHFVADNLTHMIEEEQEFLAKFHSHYSDADLIAMEGKLLASIAPDKMMMFMNMMIPAMNRDERAAMLGGMKQGAPPEAFNAVLQVAAKPNLDTADWQDLTRRLGVAA